MKRLTTKADRIAVQAADISSKLERGYKLEEYNGLKILTDDHAHAGTGKLSYYLTIYRDAVSKPIANFYYRVESQRTEAIERYKKDADTRAEYAARPKEKRTSGPALCAAAIREELKKEFPGIKFSVTSESFSMGNAVRIGWTDGPTSKMIEEITGKYQYGSFDGMTDMYSNTNSRDDIPQAKWVTESRSMSPATRTTLDAEVAKLAEGERDNLAYRLFQGTPLKPGAVIVRIEPTDTRNPDTDQYYRIVCEGGEEPKQVQTNSEDAPAVTPGTVQIVDYSEKAIAVIGETYSIREKLKSLGGRFNARLTCGKGWIFKKSDLARVKAALLPAKEPNPPGIPDNYTRSEHPEQPEGYLTPSEVKRYNAPELVAKRKESAAKIVTPQVPALWSEHGEKWGAIDEPATPLVEIAPAPLVEYAKQFNGRVAFMTVAR